MWWLRWWHALIMLLATMTFVKEGFYIESKPKGK
jgi:hypothetical protein